MDKHQIKLAEEHEVRSFIPATYRNDDQEPDARLRHPMALVFPSPVIDKDVIAGLSARPAKRPAHFQSLPLLQRLDAISNLHLFHYLFQPGIDFALKVLAVVRSSYISRNPNDPRLMAFIWTVVSGKQGTLPRMSTLGAGGGLGVLLIGPTGIGKSSLVDRLVEYLGGTARLHTSLEGRPCRWLQLGVVKVSVEDTWKGTLASIIRVVDWQLETDYFSKRERASSEGVLQRTVWAALTAHFCPLLILDEFQTLGDLSDKEALRILRGLIRLMEDAGIPVLVVGTEKVRRLLEMYPSELSKFSNEGPTELTFLKEGSQDAEVFIETYKKLHISVSPPKYSPEFNEQFMVYTMGVARVMREYMKVIFRRHGNNESLVIDRELLGDICRKEMRIFEPAMDRLRKYGSGFDLPYEDMMHYENLLPPERLPASSLQQTLNTKWILVYGVGGRMTAEAYELLRRALVKAQEKLGEHSDSALTPEQVLLQQLESELQRSCPASAAAPTPPVAREPRQGDAGRLARAAKAHKMRAKRASQKVKALSEQKVRSLEGARKSRTQVVVKPINPDEVR